MCLQHRYSKLVFDYFDSVIYIINQYYSDEQSVHNCVSALVKKVNTLSELQLVKDMEFREELRTRDSKIDALIAKQRQIMNWLTKIEHQRASPHICKFTSNLVTFT